MWHGVVVNVGTSIYYVKGSRFKLISYRGWNPVLIQIKDGKMRFGRGVQFCLFNFMIQFATIDYEVEVWT